MPLKSRGKSGRVPASLECGECKSRNYRITKIPGNPPISMKKFCSKCGHHTQHEETR